MFFLYISSLQTADAITSENSIQLAYLWINQLLATQYDFLKQYNLNNLVQLGNTNVLKFPLKAKKHEHSLLDSFVLERKKSERFAVLQLFKSKESFVYMVHIPVGIDLIVWVAILTSCHYLSNWIRMKV